MNENISSKILITDETNLGNSYYIDDLIYYYLYDDDDDFDDDDYYDNYYDNYYNSYYNNYYYPNYYYDDWDDDDYDDDDWDDDDYWYDDEEERRRREEEERRSLTLHGDTLKVGSEYDNNIWLNNVSGSYADIRVIDDSDNDNDLFITGNSRINSIISGGGVTTLWGAGGGQNTLVGGSRRNFFWYEGNSRDVATKFGTGNTAYSDVVVLANGTTYSSIFRDSASITFLLANGNYMQLQPEGASNDDDPILFSTSGSDIYRYKIARYDNSWGLNYTDDTNLFYFSQPGYLWVTGSNHNIWLGGNTGQQFVNVSTVNAGASSGYNVLVGDVASNMIVGGAGASSLWGYYGDSADTLIGGTGYDLFYAGRFEGNDVILTDQSQDVIFLYDTNWYDISYIGMYGGLTWINFNSGNTLSLYNATELTPAFQLAGGERYTFNRSTQQWQNA